MIVFRIAKNRERAADLSGTGAFRYGGRWNSKGTYMLYTSENSSLAFLENLVHQDESDLPPYLFIARIEINKQAPVYEPKNKEYPRNWMHLGNIRNQRKGDQWMLEKKFLAIKIRSAVNTAEYNFLLNPLFRGFHESVKILAIEPLNVDGRFRRSDRGTD